MTGLIRRRKGRMKMDSNVILVFDREKKNILMCRRRKPPYKGLLNLVGGKVEPGEERGACGLPGAVGGNRHHPGGHCAGQHREFHLST